MKFDGLEILEDKIKLIFGGETILSRAVIGADGVNSQVRKAIGNAHGQMHIKQGLAKALQYEISIPREQVDEIFGDWFEVHYTMNYGYGWISPLKGAVKVGVGGVGEDFQKNIKTILDDFLDELNILLHGKITRTEAHLIPMRGPHDLLSSDRILLCGDAGGFVFPGTGEGVYYAIKSGRIAGEILSWALGNGRLDAKSLGDRYNQGLEKMGLLSLRQVDFLESVLSDPERAESYVKRLGKLQE
jgi:flavin-dependent dehydrogenase